MIKSYKQAKRRNEILKYAFELYSSTPPRTGIGTQDIMDHFKLKINTKQLSNYLNDFDYLAAVHYFGGQTIIPSSNYNLSNKVSHYYHTVNFVSIWWQKVKDSVKFLSVISGIVGIIFGIWMGISSYKSNQELDILKKEINRINHLIEKSLL